MLEKLKVTFVFILVLMAYGYVGNMDYEVQKAEQELAFECEGYAYDQEIAPEYCTLPISYKYANN